MYFAHNGIEYTDETRTTIKCFTKPTQIAFYETASYCYCGGIGYGDEIICGCCGAVIPIADIYEDCELEGIINDENYTVPIKIFQWMDISTNLIGD